MEWPQGAPDKSTEIVSGDKIGMYKPTEAGTTNVKADVDDLKTFFQGDLATWITENADNITLNTANIGVNSGQIEANKDNIESNDADILALQNNVIDNDADILALETKTPQSYKTTDPVTFASLNTGQGANELYGMDQDVKKADSVEFKSVYIDNQFIANGSSVTEGTIYSIAAANGGDGTYCVTGGASGGIIFSHIKIVTGKH